MLYSMRRRLLLVMAIVACTLCCMARALAIPEYLQRTDDELQQTTSALQSAPASPMLTTLPGGLLQLGHSDLRRHPNDVLCSSAKSSSRARGQAIQAKGDADQRTQEQDAPSSK